MEPNTLIAEYRYYGRGPRPLIRDASLSARARLLYVLLDDFAGMDGSSFPGQKRLAADLGYSVWSIQDALRELETAGWITRVSRFDEESGAQRSSLYYLHAKPRPAPPEVYPEGGARSTQRGGLGIPRTEEEPLEGESEEGGGYVGAGGYPRASRPAPHQMKPKRTTTTDARQQAACAPQEATRTASGRNDTTRSVEGAQIGAHGPERYCPRHPSGTDAPCGACADARRAYEQWVLEHPSPEQLRRQARRQHRDRARSMPACDHGEPGGNVPDEQGWVACPLCRAA